ncbi:hypothetical protein FQN49_003647 [Arthroderma sp. PD_2]|nr:hypothetical protein FQN49_003647 [Arthroderma sp. PD_2]
MSFSSTSTATSNRGDVSKDVDLDNPPEDSISELVWSPIANHIAVASWDKSVRIYDVSRSIKGEGMALLSFPSPVLSCAWSPDGSKVIGSGADGSARLIDLGSNDSHGSQAQQVAQHDAPVRTVRMIQIPSSHSPIAITGSWDRKVKYWDLRQSIPIGTLACPERVYAMEVNGSQLLVAMAECHIGLVDLNQPTTIAKTPQSTLKHQTRTVSWIPDGSGYGIGSIEGRCGINYVDESNKSTAGSDGTFCFWDKDAHHRLKAFSVGGAITSTSFNLDGSIFAYAVSYDWSKGYSHNTRDYPTKAVLHPVSDAECKPKQLISRK